MKTQHRTRCNPWKWYREQISNATAGGHPRAALIVGLIVGTVLFIPVALWSLVQLFATLLSSRGAVNLSEKNNSVNLL